MQSTRLGIGGTFVHSNELISISFLLRFIDRTYAFKEEIRHIIYTWKYNTPDQAIWSNAWSMKEYSDRQRPKCSRLGVRGDFSGDGLRTGPWRSIHPRADLQNILRRGRKNWKTFLCWALENKCSPITHQPFVLILGVWGRGSRGWWWW